jgi:LemA protein
MSATKKIIIVLAVVAGIIVLGAGWYMSTYNRLVGLDESVKSGWAQVETQLQRRYDLVPNLVNTVKGYAAHEAAVFTAVTEARARAGQAQNVGDKINANRELNSALARLLVVAENYPQLKANQNFLDLQAQLEGTENRIAVARRAYNETVKQYNTAIRSFLPRLIAGSLGLAPKPFFETEAAATKAPEVSF